MNISIVSFLYNCSNCSGQKSAMPIAYTYIIFVMVIINIFGNMFAVVILLDNVWNKCVLTTILKAISYFEILFNLFIFIITLCQFTEPLSPFVKFGPKVVAAVEILLLVCDCLAIGFQMTRNWSVTILALFRYDMVCRSKTVRRKNNQSKIFSNECLPLIFIFLVVFCIGIAIPRIFEDRPKICIDTGVICDYDGYLRENKWFQYGYLGVIMFVFQSGGPIIITSFVSLMVIQKIQYRHKLHNQPGIALSNRFKKSQRNPGTLVLAVCITFTVLEFPSFFSKLAFFVFQISNIHIGVIANILIFLDSSLNLLIYLVSNKTFRKLSLSRVLCNDFVPYETQNTVKGATTTTTVKTSDCNNDNEKKDLRPEEDSQNL